MLTFKSFDQIYFYRPRVDFRKGINGLCSLIQDEMNLDPFERYLFVFTNGNRNKLKALYWDQTGFALWVKHLCEDRYKWPLHYEEEIIKVNVKNLENFLVGFDPFQVPFTDKKYSII